MTRVLELLVSLLIVTVLVVAVGALLPDHGHVERTVEVSSPVRQIFDSANTLRRFPEWSPERRLDPQLHMAYEGERNGPADPATASAHHHLPAFETHRFRSFRGNAGDTGRGIHS